ncbi:MAG: hypothetical protein HYS81_03540 [Candidatus Aenigmatarchaeota archaeon]|nr:MAG: hypothetical protein HYS81_03540 [Candidatus Aenigmarchaeota archaeon]
MASGKELFLNALVVIAGILTAILQIYRAGDVANLVLLGALLMFVVVYFIYNWLREYFDKIEKLEESANRLEGRLDYMNELHDIEKRTALLEYKASLKGAIDPRYIIVAIILFLFVLYLRTAGFI